MSHQPDSIFDKNFEEINKPRRLSVLSWWIKGYLIFIFVLGLYALLIEGYSVFGLYALDSISTYYSFVGVTAMGTILMLVAAIVSVWFEWKHAILAVIVAVICRTSYYNLTMLSINWTINYNFFTSVVIHLPFLILLIKVRKQWESEAIRKPKIVE